MKFVYFTIIYIILGLSFWYIFTSIFPNLYNNYYYSWAKGKDILYTLSLASVIPFNTNKKIVKTLYVLSGFLLLRFIWQAFAIQDYKWASEIHIMGFMFFFFIIALGLIIYINLKK